MFTLASFRTSSKLAQFKRVKPDDTLWVVALRQRLPFGQDRNLVVGQMADGVLHDGEQVGFLQRRTYAL